MLPSSSHLEGDLRKHSHALLAKDVQKFCPLTHYQIEMSEIIDNHGLWFKAMQEVSHDTMSAKDVPYTVLKCTVAKNSLTHCRPTMCEMLCLFVAMPMGTTE